MKLKMRGVEKALVAAAERIGSHVHSHVRTLEGDLEELAHRKARLEAELHAATTSCERLAHFQARIGRNYQCPKCWVRDGMNHTVRAVPSHNEADVFRCDRCGGNWIVESDPCGK